MNDSETKQILRNVKNIIDSHNKEMELIKLVDSMDHSSITIAFTGSGRDFIEIIQNGLNFSSLVPINKLKEIYPPGFLISSLHHAFIKNKHIELIRELDQSINNAYLQIEKTNNSEQLDTLNYVINKNIKQILNLLEIIFTDKPIPLIWEVEKHSYNLLNRELIYIPTPFLSEDKTHKLQHIMVRDLTTFALKSNSILSLAIGEVFECLRAEQKLKKCDKCSAFIFTADKTTHCPYCSNRESNKNAALRMKITRLMGENLSEADFIYNLTNYMKNRDFTVKEIEAKIADMKKDSMNNDNWSEMNNLFKNTDRRR
ncbi:MAG: hypothetical protein RBT15_03515 [Gudongella sp.]|jgi:Zn finger protein HypA/HybF involved in hydrogenase expression|nr:hypothetical protein [Gudongella sp.]